MVSKTLFATQPKSKVKAADTVNAAGGRAYARTNEEALCQYVVTNTFNGTFYASAEDHLSTLKSILSECSSEMIAKAAVYGHRQAKMKDTPVYLLAELANRREHVLLRKVFNKVITNAKQLCTFVQMIRSGVLGRKSFGTAVKRLVQAWITSRENMTLFNDSVGHDKPSFADIIKMVHPKATSDSQNNMFRYLLDKDFKVKSLPKDVQLFERLKKGRTPEIPNVPFRVLTNCDLSTEQWAKIAEDMPWNTLRMNLNMLERKGVFADAKVRERLVAKLGNSDEVHKSRTFPYQIMTAYDNVGLGSDIKNALQDALDASVENVPSLKGKTLIAIDISSSMGSAVTGLRGSATSVVSCANVAALMAACIVRNNKNADVMVFDTNARYINLNSRDSVVTNAAKLKFNGGGTTVSSSLRLVNSMKKDYDNVIIISDNESWADFWQGLSRMGGYAYRSQPVGTGLGHEWYEFKKRNTKAKMVLVDLQPSNNTQISSNKDVLNVGGFSDAVFEVISRFFNNEAASFVDVVKQTDID